MGKAFGDVELLFILLAKLYAEPFPEGLTAPAKIDGYVEDLSLDHTDQLALGEGLLEMEAPQHAFGGAGLVILDEDHAKAVLRHIPLVVGFHKISSWVAVDRGLDDT